ncbi:3-5 exonuclease helicase [Stemphylium lycopersici]|uniref:3-5 exonuclease helicase n=1 Tax=Stemphylium lycopersici TaxID=183478 RepID=A0A364NFM1_STELY|nr:3-5 exonuclease helicase [Stemphylium lycopersici]RAR03706.1 3-5 exonuclease helicase [Stemphylium lycopersici]RAR16125.1 3-5 exonuclease helicase [Stemphylium lycopersici]
MAVTRDEKPSRNGPEDRSMKLQSRDCGEIKTSTPHWPLSFSLRLPQSKPTSLQSYGFSSTQAPPPVWWSHRFYRNDEGKEVEILYSKTKAESEAIAQHFLNEPVIGFDMEWPWDDWKKQTLQNKVGLIQIASEDKIGLFHIGLHPGKTSAEIIAPTLKKLIEDPNVGKVGVNILRADFLRLSRWFGLKPKGAIESSHLYRLVKFGSHKPELVSIKLVSLAHQVEEQLGLPLYKGDVRTSNWSKPLSKAQIDYAAGDAYAGFMLYKCMNAKRLAMRPTPPLPIYAEKYPNGKASRDDPIILDVGDGTTITTEAFFGVKPTKSGPVSTASTAPIKKVITDPLDHTAQALYDELLVRRTLLAEKASLQPTRVITDALLEAIARVRPHDTPSLLSVKGIGKIQQQKYGDEWLQVISLFSAANGIEQPISTTKPSASKDKAENPHTQHPPRAIRNARSGPDSSVSSSSSSSQAFDDPPETPVLHTGLSFTIGETNLNENNNPALNNGNASDYDSDDTLPSLDFGTPTHRRISSGTKRKRSESPTKRTSNSTMPHVGNLDEASWALVQGHEETVDHTPSTAAAAAKRTIALTGVVSQDPLLSHALALSASTPASTKPTTPRPNPSPNMASVSTLSPASRIAKSKILAFSKLVARKVPDRPATAPPLISERAIDLIVAARPQTQEELDRIPGVDGLDLACRKVGMELLRNVVKFVGGPR